MGLFNQSSGLNASTARGLPADIRVVASSASITDLRETIGVRQSEQLDLIAINPTVPIPTDVIVGASVLVMEIDQNDLNSLRRVDQVRTLRPSLPLIVALRDASVPTVRTLIRQGVNDVCALPFNFEELHGQLCDLSARLRSEAGVDAPLGALVAIVRSTGGSGATTVATHLAGAMAKTTSGERGACLIDLDIQFGNVATSLGKASQTGVTDLLGAGARLDAELLSTAAIDTGRGFDVIVAPEAITPLESVDIDDLLHLVATARQEYGTVLVDLPANWTNWTLSVVTAATDVVLVTDLSIAGLRQAKRRLELFESVGIRSDRIRIVINRMEKRVFRTIGVDEVSRTLGMPVYATLAAEPSLVPHAQDQGLLAWEANRKSKFAADIAKLADSLSAGWGR